VHKDVGNAATQLGAFHAFWSFQHRASSTAAQLGVFHALWSFQETTVTHGWQHQCSSGRLAMEGLEDTDVEDVVARALWQLKTIGNGVDTLLNLERLGVAQA
jgi:hypothetical protein